MMSMNVVETQTPDATRPIDRAQILKAAATSGILAPGSESTPRLMALLSDPKVDSSAIAALIAGQPSMYARILRVANSSYYGHARSITTIERALMVLGRDAVRSIAAATCFDRTMARLSRSGAVDMQAVARHSLATATAAQALGKLARPSLASEAFIAGLLHNLGIAVQAHLDPRGVEALMEAHRQGAAGGIRELETAYAAVGHEACLAVVFEAWQMPEALVAVAAHHHAPMQSPEPQRDLAALVNLGATLAVAICPGYPVEATNSGRHPAAVQWLGLTDAQFDAIAEPLPARVAELESALFAA
jgi:HD-like signal output (HDOD) protein